ncbi:hypothetical protein DM860_007191 [Cuscuta australis]|uniref:Tetraspanin-15 n=1 Tax=Cuscuta australis TaxID=267555 RepID=A0A328E2T3_9ASTE|nr:hypothetical protein DM860_007191 [Cuscuta australis]
MPEDTTHQNLPEETEQVLPEHDETTTTIQKKDPPLLLLQQSTKATTVLHRKCIVLLLTIITFIMSLSIMFAVVYLLYTQQYDCEGLLGLPKLQHAIVVGLVVVFLVSNLVTYFTPRVLFPGILLVVIPLIIMLMVGLGLVGAYESEARKIPGSPPWLKFKMRDDNGWPRIKTCIYETRVCKDLRERSYLLKSYDIIPHKLSSTQVGCCRPPPACKMEYVNATYWRRPTNMTSDSSEEENRDCNLWDNNESILCYNCYTCKGGYLKTLERKWLRLGAFLIAISLLLIIMHLLLFVATMYERYGG